MSGRRELLRPHGRAEGGERITAPPHAKRFAIGEPEWWAACNRAFADRMREYRRELIAERENRADLAGVRR